MTDVHYELTVIRVLDLDTMTSIDKEIERLVEKDRLVLDRIGSGAGFGGSRDLDFLLQSPMTEEEVVALQALLRASLEDDTIDVIYEEWPRDETLAENGPNLTFVGAGVLTVH